jgi:Fic family protein
MAYIEKYTRKGRTYYYAAKSFRTPDGRWKKMRSFLGSTKPSDRTCKSAIDKLEQRARAQGLGSRPKFRYLEQSDGEVLEDIKGAFAVWFDRLDVDSREKYSTDFLVRFTYNSNAIEGNRLSLRQTAMVLTEGIFPSGTEHNDVLEALNSKDAFNYLLRYKCGLNRTMVLMLHTELMKNTKCRTIGHFRSSNVGIYGSDWQPPIAEKVPELMRGLFVWFNNNKKRLHPVELGALAHLRIAQVHPFVDGNGRTARLILNWVLHVNGYPMFVITAKEKQGYYAALELADKGDERGYVRYIAKRIIDQFTFVSSKKSVRPQNNSKKHNN